jgi:acyl-homoserine lactone acylase PvdQ
MARATRGRLVYRGQNLTVYFELNRRDMARYAVGDEVKSVVTEVAETRAKPYAISISPRSNRQHLHYADAFVVDNSHTVVIAALRRASARLVNTAGHAAAVEWGNRQTRGEGHRVLGRTLEHLHATGGEHI